MRSCPMNRIGQPPTQMFLGVRHMFLSHEQTFVGQECVMKPQELSAWKAIGLFWGTCFPLKFIMAKYKSGSRGTEYSQKSLRVQFNTTG